MHRSLQLPLGISTLRDRVCMTAAMLVLEPIFEADLPRAPRKRKKPGGEQISKSGGLFAQGSNPVGRRQAQFKTYQCLVLTHLANGFQVGCSESVLDPGGK